MLGFQNKKCKCLTHFPSKGTFILPVWSQLWSIWKGIESIVNTENVHQYITVLQSCKWNLAPFQIALIDELIEDWAAALSPYFEKKPKGKLQFGIQKYVILYYNKNTFSVSSSYTGTQPPYHIKKGRCSFPMVKAEMLMSKDHHCGRGIMSLPLIQQVWVQILVGSVS